MSTKIKLKRGPEENLPELEVGEPAFTTDTKKLYIGSNDGNKLINEDNLVDDFTDTLYAIQQATGTPIILGTAGEPSQTGKLSKYSNSYPITPEKVINEKFVEYHWDTTKWPFNEIVEVEEDGNTFIKIPKMYINLVRDSENIITERYISNVKVDDDWLLPEAFKDHANDSELDYFLVGKYNSNISNNLAMSVSGKETTTSKTIEDFRTATKANGTGYYLFDMHVKFVLETLYLIVFKNTMSDKYFPQGDSGAKQNTGALDGMTHHTGYTTGLPNYLMKFLGIENFFSNVYTFVDGVKTTSGVVYVADYEENYNSDSNLDNYYSIGNIPSDYISALGSTQGLFSMPYKTGGGANGTNFYQNQCYSSSGSSYYTLLFGRTWYSSVGNGLFYWDGTRTFSNSNSYRGGRLVKKPLH